MYVAYVLSGCCKSRSGVTYVVMAKYGCCKCMFQMIQLCSNVSAVFKRMSQVFYLDVAYVAMTIHVCCKCVFQTFHLFSDICCKCFILSRCSICFSGYKRMLQASIQNVSSVSDVCCKCVYLAVADAIHICCKRMFISVLSVSNVCCRSASCCNMSRRRKRMHAEAVPTGVAVSTCAASETGTGGPPPTCTSTGMWHALHAYVHGVQALQHVGRTYRCNSCM
jgi:hypothetical protein